MAAEPATGPDKAEEMGLPALDDVSGRQQPRPMPARALCEAERERVLDTLAGERFVDRSPAEVVATLLDDTNRFAVPLRRYS